MKKTLFIFIISISLILIIFFFFLLLKSSVNQTKTGVVNTQVGNIVEFTGTLNDFDDRCEVDISCIAYVDNKEIITNPGDVGDITLLGVSEVWNEDIGSTVKVRAIKIGVNKYTLVGDDNLYVKIVSN